MFSPFQQHLKTNYAPSNEELDDIRCFVEVSSKEVHSIDNEIDQLQQRLNLLQEKRSKACEFLDQHRALASPARQISRDVLEEIFLACLPADRNPCINTTGAPFLLTHICSSWRSIAHSLPRLWSSIHISLPRICPEVYELGNHLKYLQLQENLLQRKLDQLQVAAKEWLERSGALQLSISVFLQAHSNIYDPTIFDDIADAVARERQLHTSFLARIIGPYSNRWYDVDICLPQCVVSDLMEYELKGQRMPALKNFHIATRDSDYYYGMTRPSEPTQAMGLEAKHIVDFLSAQPTSVTLHGVVFRALDVCSILASSGLKELKELNIDFKLSCQPAAAELSDMAYPIIHKCQSLETLQVRFVNSHGYEGKSWPHHLGSIILPNLTMLSLDIGCKSSEITGFVEQLCLPSLKKLNVLFPLKSYSRDDAFARDILLTLLRNSGDTLESLGLYIPSSSVFISESIVKYLQLTPNLILLKLSSHNFDFSQDRWTPFLGPSYRDYCNIKRFVGDDFIYALSPLGKEYSDILCPKLEVLDCGRELEMGISSSALKECIKSRQSAHRIDHRIAAFRQICIQVNESRKNGDINDEKIVLGKESAILYKREEDYDRLSYSPSDGTVRRNRERGERSDFYNVYTDL